MCRLQLKGLRKKYQKIRQAGAELVIITADSVDRLAEYRAKTSCEFVLLSDSSCDVIKQYGLYNPSERNGISLPAVFIIAKTGTVRYANLEGTFFRVRAGKLLREIEKV
jgi:peroxiredoxin